MGAMHSLNDLSQETTCDKNRIPVNDVTRHVETETTSLGMVLLLLLLHPLSFYTGAG